MLAIVGPVGEIAIKTRPVRGKFMRRLTENLHAALNAEGRPGSIRYDMHRLVIDTPGDELPEALTRVFGVQTVTPVEAACEPTLEAIAAAFPPLCVERIRGKRFKVATRRTGDHDFTSVDVSRTVGAGLAPFGKVDLHHPEAVVEVEVRGTGAYLLDVKQAGAGGLPAGIQGRAVSLLSGGFDSVVSSWQILRRGVDLDYVLCNLAGPAMERSVLNVAKVLADAWSYGLAPKLHVIDFEPMVLAIRRHVSPRYVQLVLKRLMYRAASQVAADIKGEAIVTGESLGQVSSQTLSNLGNLEEAASVPVLRPLIGADKQWIVDETRRLGTYALSELVREYCALGMSRPATAARLEEVRRQEKRIDLAELARLTRERRVISLKELSDADLAGPYLWMKDVPEDAVVIDTRARHQYRHWHWPGAQNIELEALLDSFKNLDRAKKYLLYCAIGVQSAALAERMQRAGFEAYSFRGGTAPLKAIADGIEDDV